MDALEFFSSFHFVPPEQAFLCGDKLAIARSQGSSVQVCKLPADVIQTYTHHQAIEGFFLARLISDPDFCGLERADYAFTLLFSFAATQLIARGSATKMLADCESAHLLCNEITLPVKFTVMLTPKVPTIISSLKLVNASLGDKNYLAAVELLKLFEEIDGSRRKVLLSRVVGHDFGESAIRYHLPHLAGSAVASQELPAGLIAFYLIGDADHCVSMLESYLSNVSPVCTLIVYDRAAIVRHCISIFSSFLSWRSYSVKLLSFDDAAQETDYCLAVFQRSYFPARLRDDILEGMGNRSAS